MDGELVVKGEEGASKEEEVLDGTPVNSDRSSDVASPGEGSAEVCNLIWCSDRLGGDGLHLGGFSKRGMCGREMVCSGGWLTWSGRWPCQVSEYGACKRCKHQSLAMY